MPLYEETKAMKRVFRASRWLTTSSMALLAAVAASIPNVDASAQGAAAQYPDKPVRVIVPHAPGSSPDIVTRIVAQHLGERFGQSFVVENRAGAGGTIGLAQAARAAPDGYTLAIGHIGTLTINPSVYTKLPYDPAKDFTPIILQVKTPLLLVAAENAPYTSVAEVIAAAKASPGALTVSSSGNGTASHMAAEYFNTLAGVDIKHIPYKSAPDALTGVAGGSVSITFGGQPAAWPLVQGHRLRALALTSGSRVAEFPQTPVIAESVKGYEVFDWNGFIAPAGTPPQIVAKLHDAIAQILAEPDVIKQLRAQGLMPESNTSAQFGEFIKSERAKWSRVAKEVNIRLD
jgi:tripartite-type tricarboxylate transporter receptor subunit TctC